LDEVRAWVDGVATPLAEARFPVTDPAVMVGWSVFETLRVEGGRVAGLAEHLERLAGSASAALIELPDRGALAAEVAACAADVGAFGRVRVTLTGGGHRAVTGERMDPSRLHRPIRAARGPWRDEPFLGGAVKHGSRAPWVVAVKRSGLDEVLLVHEGRFKEGTTCAILAVIGGELWTHPEDGSVLASTTVTDIVARAARIGIRARREPIPADGPWDGLYVASVLRDLAPVVDLDGVALPEGDPVGRALMTARGAG
jgi:branched-subunit amino acid aminotransferase/4-amino-4-deoxychorismate lyase